MIDFGEIAAGSEMNNFIQLRKKPEGKKNQL